MNDDLDKIRKITYYFSGSVLICVVFLALFLMYSCTISFQNISTHGTATDLVDENQSASADVKADVQVPLTP